MIYAVAVNYNTPELIEDWAAALKACVQEVSLTIVDNFSTPAARSLAQEVCGRLGIRIIEKENIGYGRALNAGLKVLKRENQLAPTDLILLGNVDLSVSHIPQIKTGTPQAYLPQIRQGNRQTNPFLTKAQSRCLPLYDLAAWTSSPITLKVVAGLLKCLGLLPSPAYACHGALFAINGACAKLLPDPLFNEDSFLYCEELEFAEALRSKRIALVSSEIMAAHIGRVSTAETTKTVNDFIALWAPSWRAWRRRWS